MICVTLLFLQLPSIAQEVVTVSSMEELWEISALSDQEVVMTPGVYVVNQSNMLSRPDKYKWSGTVLRISGSNNTYDFTGVKIEVDFDSFFQMVPKAEIINFHNTGSNNVFKNLEIEDIIADVNSLDCSIFGGALGVKFDGNDNLMEGFKLTIRGSFPYGYGDIFGKAGTCNQIGHCKHSGYLIRGERNHLLNCELYSRAYGHGIFVQGGIDTIIEGCYIEGELRTTDEVYDEIGTNSPADKVYQQYGYFRTSNDCNMAQNNEDNPDFEELGLERGWRFSCQEDGIRAYTSGPVWDHEREQETTTHQRTTNMTVLNCTVKNFRSGVVITHASGVKYAEGCVSIGCETAYSMGTGVVVDSKGDATNGPLIVHEYSNDRNGYAELELLKSEHEEDEGKYNDMMAWLSGSNHNFTFKYAEGEEFSEDAAPPYDIRIAGVRRGWRHVYGDKDYAVTNSTVKNYTHAPVALGDKSADNKYLTLGEAEDLGTNNSLIEAVADYDCGDNIIEAITVENEEELVKGINYKYYEGAFVNIPDFESITPVKEGLADGVNLHEKEDGEKYAFEFDGYFKISETGPYRFNLASSDGSNLYINDELIIENGVRQDLVELSEIVCLEEGFHKIRVEYLQYQNVDMLSLTKENSETSERLSFYCHFEEDGEEPGEGEPGDGEEEEIVSSVTGKLIFENFTSPNPVKDRLYIDVPQALKNAGDLKVVIYNVNGNRIISRGVKADVALDVSTLPVGLYFVHLSSVNKIYANKILKVAP
ncbi:PA14 domain-containing protein [Persicobacter psychrovividus]|uniref:PA14 domain-containing protein n=1 Tax=Persicobacter psychrovividus TaxID=387638 RepID=UPI0030CA47C0